MTREDLVETSRTPEPVDETLVPGALAAGRPAPRLGYRFEPGAADDGVTVQVPLPLLARLRPDGFDWQVPGLRDELVTALIKSLPKAIRRNVVPAADWARKLIAELPTEPDGRAHRETRRAHPREDLRAGHRRRLRPRPGARPPAGDLRRARRARQAARRGQGARRAAAAAEGERAGERRAGIRRRAQRARTRPGSRPGTSTSCRRRSTRSRAATPSAPTPRSSTRARASPSGS